jgi:hypothetical protein
MVFRYMKELFFELLWKSHQTRNFIILRTQIVRALYFWVCSCVFEVSAEVFY